MLLLRKKATCVRYIHTFVIQQGLVVIINTERYNEADSSLSIVFLPSKPRGKMLKVKLNHGKQKCFEGGIKFYEYRCTLTKDKLLLHHVDTLKKKMPKWINVNCLYFIGYQSYTKILINHASYQSLASALLPFFQSISHPL